MSEVDKIEYKTSTNTIFRVLKNEKYVGKISKTSFKWVVQTAAQHRKAVKRERGSRSHTNPSKILHTDSKIIFVGKNEKKTKNVKKNDLPNHESQSKAAKIKRDNLSYSKFGSKSTHTIFNNETSLKCQEKT